MKAFEQQFLPVEYVIKPTPEGEGLVRVDHLFTGIEENPNGRRPQIQKVLDENQKPISQETVLVEFTPETPFSVLELCRQSAGKITDSKEHGDTLSIPSRRHTPYPAGRFLDMQTTGYDAPLWAERWGGR